MNKGLHILLLEDNPNDAVLIERELRRTGQSFSLQRVETKETFARELEDPLPDIILSDYLLPSFDGLSALVIAQEKCPDVPFIFVSGAIGEEMAIETLKKGATDYVLKDRLSRLVPVVKRALKEVKERIKRQKAEEELVKKAKIIDMIPDAVITTDLHGNVTSYNTGAEQMYGYNAREVIGKPVSMFYSVEDIPLLMSQIKELLKGNLISSVEARIIGKDKKEVPIILSLASIRDIEGKIIELAGVAKDITERKKMEEALKTSLKEKEVLLKEVHHRVKNNLQLISSLLNLEARYTKDKQTLKMFEECQDRIRSIGLIHEKLSKSKDLARIDFAEYIQSLVVHLYHSYKVNPELVKLKINIGDVLLNLDTAIPCGLIINELISNSLEHAFPKDRKGEICINLHLDDDKFTLIISDNGIGFSKNLDFRNTETLGLQLLCTLVDQLGGSIKFDRSGGTEFKITFREVKRG